MLHVIDNIFRFVKFQCDKLYVICMCKPNIIVYRLIIRPLYNLYYARKQFKFEQTSPIRQNDVL